VQYNFTDPESRIMKSPDGFVQAYNVQVAVDELQLIVGQAVTRETNDKKQLMAMNTIIERQSGDTPTQLLADAGYSSHESLTAIGDTRIDAYISTRKQKHGERPGRCPRGPVPKTATIVDRMSRSLVTKTGAAVYGARKRNGRTGHRPDQAGSRFSAISIARRSEGRGGMVVGLRDRQHSQAVSSVRLRPRQRHGPLSGTSSTAIPSTPRAATHPVDAEHDVSDFHGVYSDGLLAEPCRTEPSRTL
jgi:Transposase DDE domain